MTFKDLRPTNIVFKLEYSYVEKSGILRPFRVVSKHSDYEFDKLNEPAESYLIVPTVKQNIDRKITELVRTSEICEKDFVEFKDDSVNFSCFYYNVNAALDKFKEFVSECHDDVRLVGFILEEEFHDMSMKLTMFKPRGQQSDLWKPDEKTGEIYAEIAPCHISDEEINSTGKGLIKIYEKDRYNKFWDKKNGVDALKIYAFSDEQINELLFEWHKGLFDL